MARNLLRRISLRSLFFGLLLLAGIVPVVVSSIWTVNRNKDVIESERITHLTRSSQYLGEQINDDLASKRQRLAQLGESLLLSANGAPMEEHLRQPWVEQYFGNFARTTPDLVALRLLNPEGVGPAFAPAALEPTVAEALTGTFERARTDREAVYRLVGLDGGARPALLLVVPVSAGGQTLFVQGLMRASLITNTFGSVSEAEVSAFLLDRTGRVLWFEGDDPLQRESVARSVDVQSHVATPVNATATYDLLIGEEKLAVVGIFSPLAEAEWSVLLQRPRSVAFLAVREMIQNTALSSALLVFFALLAAVAAASRIAGPIQELAETSHEIAAGNFGKKIEPSGVARELDDLARDFNRMSGHVQVHVAKLATAAKVNQELFLGSMRAFVAAIDAKDPYTRGHSERVADYSRAIARQLGLPSEAVDKVWIGALLHDVGKIGIDDRVLNKGGVLTDEEYELMKKHPVIGAEIMSRIEQLREMIPAIRWHHEAWNGTGYPDRLQGERIPLMARIVGVADTFDAITTVRPYQKAFTQEQALEMVRKLVGKRFDAKVVSAFFRAFEHGEIRLPESSQTVEAPETAAVS